MSFRLRQYVQKLHILYLPAIQEIQKCLVMTERSMSNSVAISEQFMNFVKLAKILLIHYLYPPEPPDPQRRRRTMKIWK